MHCLPDLTTGRESPFWVNRSSILKYFNQADFHCRESRNVVSAYLTEWFHTPEDGILRFNLPTVQFLTGTGMTEFINGRHRTAVLMQYLNEIPIAFSEVSPPPHEFLSQLSLRPLSLHESLELPDLPRKKRLP